MNSIRFEASNASGEIADAVEIFIDDRNLIELAKEAELPWAKREGAPQLAGSYVGLSAEMLLENVSEAMNSGDAADVFGCGDCGEPGCWPLQVRIKRQSEAVIWFDFKQPFRPIWEHENVGPFKFDRSQYEQALNELRKLAES